MLISYDSSGQTYAVLHFILTTCEGLIVDELLIYEQPAWCIYALMMSMCLSNTIKLLCNICITYMYILIFVFYIFKYVTLFSILFAQRYKIMDIILFYRKFV